MGRVYSHKALEDGAIAALAVLPAVARRGGRSLVVASRQWRAGVFLLFGGFHSNPSCRWIGIRCWMIGKVGGACYLLQVAGFARGGGERVLRSKVDAPWSGYFTRGEFPWKTLECSAMQTPRVQPRGYPDAEKLLNLR
jgi:hypothetical protein